MVRIANLTSNKINEAFVQRVVNFVLKKENKRGEISVAFVGPNRIRALNKKFLGRNRITDVLSFSETEIERQFFGPSNTTPLPFLGEIIVCLRAVKKNSRREGIPFEKELAHVLIHATLHLLGYEHGQEENDKMRQKEKKYLAELNL